MRREIYLLLITEEQKIARKRINWMLIKFMNEKIYRNTNKSGFLSMKLIRSATSRVTIAIRLTNLKNRMKKIQ